MLADWIADLSDFTSRWDVRIVALLVIIGLGGLLWYMRKKRQSDE